MRLYIVIILKPKGHCEKSIIFLFTAKATPKFGLACPLVSLVESEINLEIHLDIVGRKREGYD